MVVLDKIIMRGVFLIGGMALLAGMAFFSAIGCVDMKGARAYAQVPGNSLTPQNRHFESISAADVISMLNKMGIVAQVQQPQNPTASPNVQAQTPDGGRFYVDFPSCENQAALTGCRSLLFRAAMANTGVSYQDLNSYNLRANVIKAINLPERNLLIFMRLAIISGGVGELQLQIQTALFLKDMDDYIKSQVSSTSVSYSRKAPEASEAPDGSGALPGAYDKTAPLSGFGSHVHQDTDYVDASMIESAIFNTKSVGFMTDEARALLP